MTFKKKWVLHPTEGAVEPCFYIMHAFKFLENHKRELE